MESLNTILAGCFKKEARYQKLLYERYFGFALKTVFRYIYRYEKAVDITNDGFVKFFKKIKQFRYKDDEVTEKIFFAYLKKIMIHTAIDELRRNKMTPEIGGIPEHVFDVADKNENAEQMMIYKELIILIKQLPPQLRTVFNLFVTDGFNHLEISEVLHIPVGTSKSNLSRARKILQEKITKNEDAILCSI